MNQATTHELLIIINNPRVVYNQMYEWRCYSETLFKMFVLFIQFIVSSINLMVMCGSTCIS